MKSAAIRIGTLGLLFGVLGVTGCEKAPLCTEEQAENRDTADCSNEVELVTYTADKSDSVTLSQAWRSGRHVHLEGDVREVIVQEGEDDAVTVTYRAQVDLADGRSESFVLDVMDNLEVDFERRGETLRFEVSHPNTNANLGATAVVALPPDFDGRLSIQKYGAPGNVTVRHLGRAIGLDIDMEHPDAELVIEDTGAVREARLNAAGSIETAAFSSNRLERVAINSEEGDIVTAFDVVPRSHATLLTGKIKGSSIKGTGGNLTVTLPEDSDFTLATYTKNRARFDGVSDCSLYEIASDIRKLVCGYGDVDGLLTFKLTSSQDITVRIR
jgi:hypothetical protein